MTTALATAWRPRGELDRFLKLLPSLSSAYAGISISLPPEVGEDVVHHLQEYPDVMVNVTSDWSWGRYVALEGALGFSSTHIQYADFDRLLRWVETRPEEWQQILNRIIESDCLIIGRTPKAYQTHPQALVKTEAISNQVISFLLGKSIDVSAGSKSFSQEAAEFIVGNCSPGHALGTDAEWPIILNRAGFQVDFVTVDGLDWESADRYRDQAADQVDQQEAALNYDADPQNWAKRIGVAIEIIQTGFEAANRELSSHPKDEGRVRSPASEFSAVGEDDFNFEAVFDVDDYLYFYREGLTEERTQAELNFLVNELALDENCRILDLACGYGRHANPLAALGHEVTGVDLVPGFLEFAQREASEKQISVDYIQGDMRRIDFNQEFDRVLLLFTSFGYFADDENLLVLKNVKRALKPGGLFVFDTHNRDAFLKSMLPFIVTEVGDDLIIDRVTFDKSSGRMYNQRIVIRDGVRKDKPFFVRLYNSNEIEELILKAGMEVHKMFGGFDSQPLSSESPRLVIIAKNPIN